MSIPETKPLPAQLENLRLQYRNTKAEALQAEDIYAAALKAAFFLQPGDIFEGRSYAGRPDMVGKVYRLRVDEAGGNDLEVYIEYHEKTKSGWRSRRDMLTPRPETHKLIGHEEPENG